MRALVLSCLLACNTSVHLKAGEHLGPDGAILEACDGYDAAAYRAPGPSCTWPDAQPCATWVASVAPTDLAVIGSCFGDDGGPSACHAVIEGYATCSADGGAECQAKWAPYLRGSVAATRCQEVYMGGPPAHYWVCVWDADCQSCPPETLCARDANQNLKCVWPCE